MHKIASTITTKTKTLAHNFKIFKCKSKNSLQIF